MSVDILSKGYYINNKRLKGDSQAIQWRSKVVDATNGVNTRSAIVATFHSMTSFIKRTGEKALIAFLALLPSATRQTNCAVSESELIAYIY